MKKGILFSTMAVALFVVVVWLMDPYLLMIVGIMVAYGVIPIALAMVIWLIFAFSTGRSGRPAIAVLAKLLGFACFVALSFPANHFVQEQAVVAAKEYPTHIAPLLEAYRMAHGVYPANLDQLPSKPSVPRLLRRPFGYRLNGSYYSFHFSQPGGLIDVWDYSSETHTWHLST